MWERDCTSIHYSSEDKTEKYYNQQGCEFNEEHLNTWAHLLTDEDAIYQKFFSHLSAAVQESVQEARGDNADDLTGQELEKKGERQRRRIGRVVLPITLYLKELDTDEIGLSFSAGWWGLSMVLSMLQSKWGM